MVTSWHKYYIQICNLIQELKQQTKCLLVFKMNNARLGNLVTTNLAEKIKRIKDFSHAVLEF